MGLAEQYKEVLNQNIFGVLAVFDYATDFYRFWNENGDGDGDGQASLPAPEIIEVASGSTQKALVIIWDDMPDDKSDNGKLLVSHLTPLDWALAFALRMLELGKVDRADFSIHIIDFTVKAYEDAFVSRMRDTLLAEMPWVRLYAPLVPEGARYRRGFKHITELIPVEDVYGQPTLFILPPDVLTMANSLKGQEEPVKQALGLVANAWRSSVIQSDDHHDLNNIVAPILMSIIMKMGKATPGNDESIMTAFVHRLSWCGLLDKELDKETEKFNAPEITSPLDIVVIDDQLAMGWDKVLGALVGIPHQNVKATPRSDQFEALGSSSSVNLFGATDPNCLLKALGITKVADTVKIDINLYKQRKFDSPVLSVNSSRPWMLVLDLRLFSGRISEEREWYRTLARAAIQIVEDCKDKLAWSGFDEREQIQHLANGGALDEAHTDTALSLFARLCALRWPSVPIIVFSATGRRGLIAKLAEYGNIFLSSQKPNVLTGNQGEQIAVFTDSWNREIHSAKSLVQVQKSLLCLAERFSQDEIAKNKHNVSTSIGQHKHVVLAFDESGDFDPGESPAVGGVIALVDAISREDALQKFAKFEEESRAVGLKFYDFAPINWSTMPPSEIKDSNHPALPKEALVSTKLVPLLKQSHNLKMGVFRLSITIPHRTSPSWSDSEYMLALRACLELALCELPRSIGIQWGISSSLAIWLPSRRRPFASEKQAIKESRQYDFRWEQKKSKYVESLGGYGAAYSIVVSAIGGRGNASEIIGSVTGVKTRTIPYTTIQKRLNDAQSALFWYCPKCKQAIFPRGHSSKNCQRIKCNHGNYGGAEDETWPDYSVMLHLADAMLGLGDLPAEKDCEAVINKNISFDVVLDMSMQDFLHASRLFDQEQSPDAFKLGFKHGFFTEGLNKPGGFSKAKIESGLVSQFWHHALQINGTTLAELAGIRTRRIEALMGVAVSRNQQRKNNHEPKKAGAQQAGSQRPSNQENPFPKASVPQLGKNELRIIHSDAVGDDGVLYAVLALDNGIPCALLSMDDRVAECKTGQIVVVKKMMGSNCHAKVSQAELKLAILELERLI